LIIAFASRADCRPEYVRVVRQRGLNPERAQARDSAYKRRRYRERAKVGDRTRKRAARMQERATRLARDV
jgi:hypothetical protein